MPEKVTKAAVFTRDRETKNTVKFTEVPVQGEAPIVGTLYVQKWVAGAANNVKLTLEIH
jgi:hypothetical protein